MFLMICSSMLRWPPVTWLRSDLAALASFTTRSTWKWRPSLTRLGACSQTCSACGTRETPAQHQHF